MYNKVVYFFRTLDDTACTTECFLLTKFPGVLVVETEPLVVSNSGCIVPIKNPIWDHPKISITTPLELPKFSFLGNIQTGHQAGNVPFPSWKQKNTRNSKVQRLQLSYQLLRFHAVTFSKRLCLFRFFFSGTFKFYQRQELTAALESYEAGAAENTYTSSVSEN